MTYPNASEATCCDGRGWNLRDGRVDPCRASTASGERCNFRGTRHELHEHAEEAGHTRCILCTDALNDYERQTCTRCANKTRDDLDAVETAYGNLERVIGEAAYRGIAWTQLAMVNDGSTTGGGEDDHPRWHDPLPPAAVLDNFERDWRETFGHGRPPYPVQGHPDRRASVVVRQAISYLRTWHTLAARTHPGFDDYASELRTLRVQLEHAAGVADDPERAAAECFDCHGSLVRRYGDHGLEDAWTCRDCGAEYDQPRYYLALRNEAAMSEAFVPLADAARAARIPAYIVRNWFDRGQLRGYCQVFPKHRHMVWWPDVHDRESARLGDETTAM